MRIAAYVVLGSLLLTSVPAQGKIRTIYVFVASCDNEHQGIVPVPKTLGDGDDPANNLYWGAMYGTKSFLKRSGHWTPVATEKKPTATILERVVFKHASSDAYLVADACRGREIKKAVQDLLDAAGGKNATTLPCGGASLGLHGAADLVVYIGHNGLMDFSVAQPQREPNTGAR